MRRIHLFILFLTVVLFSVSCKKDDHEPTPEPEVTTGLYVLSEGNFMANNTMLTYYDFGTQTATTDFYKNVNGSSLGDTGNDMIIYGGKLYIVMNVSGYLEVADAFTGKSIKKIQLKDGSSASIQPRYVVPHKSQLFVSSYDGTVTVIDTASLNIVKSIEVGKNPEEMVISGEKLYVTNSGGLSPGFDSTLSVIDLNTLTETGKIKVGINPTTITADNSGNLYVGLTGIWGESTGSVVKVNTATNSIDKSADTAVGKLVFHDGKLFASGGYFGSANVRVLSTSDFSAASANFVTDGTEIAIPYALSIDKSNGDVYIGDAVDYVSPGKVHCFDKTGKKKFSVSVAPGVGPNSVAFIRK